jgi:PBP1b-binding outer membrane lipoprotein LpoB
MTSSIKLKIRQFIFLGSALALPLGLQSCATTATRVDSSQFRSTMGLDPQDVAEVATEMAESLLRANILKNKGANGRSVIAISNCRNNTSLYDFDPNMIYKRVTTTLNQSGVAYCYVKNGDDSFVSGNRSSVAGENEVRGFLGEAKASSGPSPQYSMTLELIENANYIGNRTQKAYQIHMAINQIGKGLSVWEDIRDVNKLGKRAAIGL